MMCLCLETHGIDDVYPYLLSVSGAEATDRLSSMEANKRVDICSRSLNVIWLAERKRQRKVQV